MDSDIKINRNLALLRKEISGLRVELRELLDLIGEFQMQMKEQRSEMRADIRSFCERIESKVNSIGFYVSRANCGSRLVGRLKRSTDIDPSLLN